MKNNWSLRNISLMHLFHQILLLLLMAGLLTSCESRKIIVNKLEEKEANEILVFLSSKGIDAVKVEASSEGTVGGKGTLWNISVEATQANEAMALLNQAGLPRRPGTTLLGIFSNVGLVPSGMQEKIRYQAGLGEQIANTIRKIDGVLDAEVQISFPEEDPLNPGATKQPMTAYVYVKHSGVMDDPNAHMITRIKRLVAGGVPGLDFDNVTVIPDRARFSETPGGVIGGFGEEERPLVNVWSIVIAKSSLTRFQAIFFSSIIAILLLLLMVIWLLWKFLPILKKTGGFKQLFSFHPISTENLAPKAAPPAEGEAKQEEEEKSEKEDETDQGAGVT